MLSLHYNGVNSYLFANGTEVIKLKTKNPETFSYDNMKKTVFYGYVDDFSVDYDAIAVDDIQDIHKYLMKKNDIV